MSSNIPFMAVIKKGIRKQFEIVYIATSFPEHHEDTIYTDAEALRSRS